MPPEIPPDLGGASLAVVWGAGAVGCPPLFPTSIPSNFEMPGKPKGSKNYQKEILLEIIEDVLPAGAEDWKLVLERYQDRTKDNAPRDPDDVKRYFFEKLANKCRAPTGQSCPPALVSRAQQIYRKVWIPIARGAIPPPAMPKTKTNNASLRWK